MKKINQEKIDQVCEQSRNSPRKRQNYNYHEELSDSLQRLLNAMQPGTYIQPHKHENPDKREAFLVLQGRVLVVTFTADGEIDDHILLDAKKGNYGAEIPARTWHTLIILEKDSVVYEVKDGPYQKIDDKNFAPWAPKEKEESCLPYINSILEKLSINI